MYNVHELQWYGFIDTWSRSWLWLRLTRQKRWQAAVSGESGATQGCVTQCVVPSTLRRSLGLPYVSIQLERCHIAGDTMQVAFFRFWDEFQKFLAAQSSGWSLRKVIQRVASLSLPRGSLSGDKHLSHGGGEVCQSCRCKTSSPPFCQRWRWEGERRWWIQSWHHRERKGDQSSKILEEVGGTEDPSRVRNMKTTWQSFASHIVTYIPSGGKVDIEIRSKNIKEYQLQPHHRAGDQPWRTLGHHWLQETLGGLQVHQGPLQGHQGPLQGHQGPLKGHQGPLQELKEEGSVPFLSLAYIYSFISDICLFLIPSLYFLFCDLIW